jgi:hypothetical protein
MYGFHGFGWPIPNLIVPRVRVSYHWRRRDGEARPFEGVRTELPHSLWPGQSARFVAAVVAPPDPGRFNLRWDLVVENVSWFSTQGWAAPELEIEVEPSARAEAAIDRPA